MEVIDLSWNDSLNKRSNSHLLPKSIRGLIVGKSGCGKTTLLLNLLLRPVWLDYNNLRVFGKSLFQLKYQILKKAFDKKLSKEAIFRLFNCEDDIHSFIHYGDLYSAPSKLLLRSAPDPCTAKKKSFETRVECVRKNP